MEKEIMRKIARLEVLKEKPLTPHYVWSQLLEIVELEQEIADFYKEIKSV